MLTLLRRYARTSVVVAVATVVLAGCGGDDASGDDSPPESPSSDDTSQVDDDTDASAKCVGDGKGSITAKLNEPVELPGGSTATLAYTKLDEDPPTITFKLGQSTVIEQKNATSLTVGDKFGVARGVYEVVSICDGKASIDAF